MTELLESQNIHTCLLPPNTTDLLQPLDLSVNKAVKDFLRQCFEEWYSKEVTKQFDTDQSAIEPVNLGLPVLHALGAKWLVDMSEFFSSNPDIIGHGFVKAGIAAALDGSMDEQDNADSVDLSSESDFEIESD